LGFHIEYIPMTKAVYKCGYCGQERTTTPSLLSQDTHK
jgi:hypothetical protein